MYWGGINEQKVATQTHLHTTQLTHVQGSCCHWKGFHSLGLSAGFHWSGCSLHVCNMELANLFSIIVILELVQHFRTYKCLALTSWFNPGETGICPVSWFADMSNQIRFERRPSVGGIPPVNLFEFSALHKEIINWIHMMNRILSIEYLPNLSNFLQECELR